MQIQCLYDTDLTYTAYTKLRVFVPFLDLILLLTGQCYIHVGKQPVFGYMFYYLFSYLILFYTLENIINHVYQNTYLSWLYYY